MTGVVSVLDDMCINSCTAFTGPLSDLDTCPYCSERRFEVRSGKSYPRKQACTIPLGPQIQALRRSPEGAAELGYRDRKTAEVLRAYNEAENADNLVYDDIFSGNDVQTLCDRLSLTVDDITVSFSLDGAQLYVSKKSDTWIAIWIIDDYDPTTRYKKRRVLPALIVPGPNKPKNIDSFLFRSFYHVSALQRENNGAGLRVWDALQ